MCIQKENYDINFFEIEGMLIHALRINSKNLENKNCIYFELHKICDAWKKCAPVFSVVHFIHGWNLKTNKILVKVKDIREVNVVTSTQKQKYTNWWRIEIKVEFYSKFWSVFCSNQKTVWYNITFLIYF